MSIGSPDFLRVLEMIGRVFLNRYEIQRLIGEGGMGRVFLARQTDLRREVVVKVMHDHVAEDPKFRERFLRETLLMARFHHPHAVTLYDASLNDPNGPCIVMEYVKGGNLELLLSKVRKMTAPRVGRIIGQLCEVLQAAHDEGMIHRDLKPANLMVVHPDTPQERIKVMDFGLAKLINDGPASKVTDTAIDFAVGTPAYICPEQVRGEQMDHRGDLYSVGVMAFELLSGRLPFQGTSGMDVLLAHATEPPPTFAEIGLGSWVPPGVEAVIRRTLNKDPDDRPQSARELAELFASALQGQQTRSKSSWQEQGPAQVERPDLESEIILDLQPADPRSSAEDCRRQRISEVAADVPTVPESRNSARVSRRPDSPTQPAGELEQGREQNALPFQMDAWMPETIALMKLKGFVHDNGGKVLECKPGRVVVQLKGSNAYSAIGWLGFAPRSAGPIDIALRLVRPDPKRESQLKIHVFFHPSDPILLADRAWRDRCSNIFVELRGYLMGNSPT